MGIVELLIQDEGMRLKPYTDTVGKLTIGVGRNLTDRGLSQDEALYLLTNDIRNVQRGLADRFPWYLHLDDVRKMVVESMTFNMGIEGFTQFKNTIGHIQAGEYEKAADEMLASKWASQVGARATRLSNMMRTGCQTN